MKVNVLKRAGMVLSAVALVLGGVAGPALLAPAPAWAQPSGIVPFTPAGLGTDHYVIPTSAEQLPFMGPSIAAVVVGFENDTDASVTVTSYSVSSNYVWVLNAGQVTVPSGGTYLNDVEMSVDGPQTFQVTLSNGQTVTWTIDAEFLFPSEVASLPSLILSPVMGNLGEVEPPLSKTGTSTFGTVRFVVAPRNLPGEVSLDSCAATAPLELGPGACQTTSEGGAITVMADVGFPVQISLGGWQPGPAVAGVVAAVTLSVPTTLAREYRLPPSLAAVVAVPVLYTVPEVIPSSISASASSSDWTPVGFTAGRDDGGIALVSASLSGADQADFEVEPSASAHTPPPGGGTWNPIDVKLVAKAPGTYTADIVATFDPTGGDFTVTIPVTGSVPGVTSSGSGSSTTQSSSGSGSSNPPTSSGSGSSTTQTSSGSGSSNPPTLIGLGSSTSQSSSGSGSSTTPSSPPVFTSPPPEPVAVGETCGAAGTEVQIWGENLAGSVVRFANATSGGVTMLSPTEAEATVPHGVDGLGPITVIGPGGQAAQVPGVTWDPACQTRTMAWATPGGPGQVVLHVALVSASSASHLLLDRTVVVLGRDGEQVERFETGSAPTTFLLPISEGPFTAVFDGGAHFGPSESAAVG